MCLIQKIYFHLTIILSILNGNRCIYRSQIELSDPGFKFQPVYYQGQIISTFINQINLLRSCYKLCSENNLCRIFDINAVVPNQCRLFQGDVNVHGTVILSSINNARVGLIQYSTNLYLNYGQSCSSDSGENRYLICGNNFTWECAPNTYWNSSVSKCVSQSPLLGSICQQNMSMCREDLNYTCLQYNQCGPLSLLMGKTLADRNTSISHSPTVGVVSPYTILVNQTTNNSIIVINQSPPQIISFYDVGSSINNVTLVAQNWSGGNQLGTPFGLAIHPQQKSILYVSDQLNNIILKIVNMQVVSPTPTIVAGTKTIFGSSAANTFDGPVGVSVDSNGTIYVADSANHRIMRWGPTSTSGTRVAGLGTAGSDSFSLRNPFGVIVDENNSYIYVCDTNNHRIQRFSLFGGSPNNGTTVAGGNGQGTASNQLNGPFSFYITKKTKTIYIADTANNRVQRWYEGGQDGVTIAGDPNGIAGSNASMFINTYGIAVNDDETYLYVADRGNSRIQRFDLV